MARILFFHYRHAKEGKPVLRALQDAGHHVTEAVPEYADFKPSLEVARPEVVVADCTEAFNKVVEACDYITSTKQYKAVPVVLTNLDPGNHGYVKAKLGDATVVAPGDVVGAVAAAVDPGA